MPSVSFAKPSADAAAPAPTTAATPAPVVEPASTAASPPAQAVVIAPTLAVSKPSGLVLGDKIPDFGDIVIPRLNLSQNIGELGKSFEPGSVVFNQEVLLYRPPVIDAKTNAVKEAGTPPVTVTCLGFRPTRFVEQVPGGAKGMIVNSEAEVRAAGGTLDYNEHKLKEKDGMRKFNPLADAFMAIERPDFMADDDTVFCYPCVGKKFALALWGLTRTSYTAAAKGVFFTKRAMGCLREGGYPSYSFKLSTRWKSFGDSNGAWIPVLVEPQKQSVEFLAWVQSVLNPAEAINSGAESA